MRMLLKLMEPASVEELYSEVVEDVDVEAYAAEEPLVCVYAYEEWELLPDAFVRQAYCEEDT